MILVFFVTGHSVQISSILLQLMTFPGIDMNNFVYTIFVAGCYHGVVGITHLLAATYVNINIQHCLTALLYLALQMRRLRDDEN